MSFRSEFSLPTDRQQVMARIPTFLLFVLAAYLLFSFGGNLIQIYLYRDGGLDFRVGYLPAVTQLLNGQSPYLDLPAGPIARYASGYSYVYPPTFAWLLTPFLALPAQTATLLWLGLQTILLCLAVWIAAIAAGARKRVRLILLLIIATILYIPTYDALQTGNVGVIITLGMALLLRSALIRPEGDKASGAIATALGVLKLTPGLVLLPLLVNNPRKYLPSALVTLAILVIPFFLLNPGAWLDYAQVPFRLAAGSVWYHNNFALATVLAYHWPASAPLIPAIRLATPLLALGLLGLSILKARQFGGLPAALILAYTASLLLMGVVWGNYFEALLPGFIIVWIKTGRRGRLGLSLGYLLLWSGLVWPPLETTGMILIIIITLKILWSNTIREVSPDLQERIISRRLQIKDLARDVT